MERNRKHTRYEGGRKRTKSGETESRKKEKQKVKLPVTVGLKRTRKGGVSCQIYQRYEKQSRLGQEKATRQGSSLPALLSLFLAQQQKGRGKRYLHQVGRDDKNDWIGLKEAWWVF